MTIPKALEIAGSWCAQRKESGHLLVALDFDGTIAPIVSKSQDARMLAPARAAIERLLERPDTDVAIVSGRALDDLRERCAIPGVYYAGNHGLQIDGPGVHETRPDAVELIPRIRTIGRQLTTALAGIPGAVVEDKELTLSVHTRLTPDPADRARVDEIVRQLFKTDPNGLRLMRGKRVIEVRPDTDWHKGAATLFLIERVAAARRSKLYALFIGDDVTDEDAFASMRGVGTGIVVGDPPPQATAAGAWLASPEAVVELLEMLGHDECH